VCLGYQFIIEILLTFKFIFNTDYFFYYLDIMRFFKLKSVENFIKLVFD
jgi:hypothetical protein